MTNEDLIKIKEMLTKLVNYIDKSIDKDINGCLHEDNTRNLTTMGMEFNKFKCMDCGKVWEEKFEENDEFIFSETIGAGSASDRK